jgi:excinuclease ABC A subunit
MEQVREWVRIAGAREHNLAGIDVRIPKGYLTVVTGVSGSGKSSLVFDTIAAEARRQLNETLPAFVRGFLPSTPRPAVDLVEHLPAAVAVDQRPLRGGARSTVGTITDIAPLLRLLFSRAGEPFVGHPDAFSFSMPAGMCPDCEGLGVITDVDLDAFLDESRSLNEGALLAPPFAVGSRDWHLLAARTDPDRRVADLTDEERELLLDGSGGTVPIEMAGARVNLTYEGAVTKFRRRYLARDSAELGERTRQMVAQFTTSVPCPSCGGTRLSPLALSCRIGGYSIADLSAMEAERMLDVLRALPTPGAEPVLDAVAARVRHLVRIGLGYLSLDRATASLSGGEAQRVKIVRHLSSSLNDLLYVFDEPSAGLHPRDVHLLLELLRALRDKGNTVLVVEHDRDVIAAADHVVDLGPGPGAAGGRVVFAGPVTELAGTPSPTGRSLTAHPRLKDMLREPTGTLPIVDARRHNLRGIDLELPTGVLTAVSGVAGSGKSTLVHEVLRAQHPEVVAVDQSPPRANRRSTVLTFTGAADHVRAAFARAGGVSPALFSANSAGACETCRGLGVVEIDLAFLDGVTTTCQTCAGRRFTEEVLAHRLRGCTISDVLEMPVSRGREFFAGNRRIAPVLATLADVGLDYLRLGQPLTALSGGECQRIKLAAHLRDRAGTVVLDEPTAGLHAADVGRLLEVLDRLVDERGATVVVVEHNLDVVAHADWVVDLGPEGGSRGGQVLFSGRPRDLLRTGTHTATHLATAVGT